MLNTFKNLLLTPTQYRHADNAIIISCYFNPQKSFYRKMAFDRFYESIKHLDHRIIECIIGDAKPELFYKSVSHIFTPNLLWHKESILNKIISDLPPKYKYIFWVDADVIFSNRDWLRDAVHQFKNGARILQPFEFCFHMEKGQDNISSFTADNMRQRVNNTIPVKDRRVWRSFSSNRVFSDYLSNSTDYDRHGHVGFAWGALREVLDECPLYDKALIGGADHIIAHAAAGHIGHSCIKKAFNEQSEEIEAWSRKFFAAAQNKFGYVSGDLFHIWHGDIANRQYLTRIQKFDPINKQIVNRDENGLFVAPTAINSDAMMWDYFNTREVAPETNNEFQGFEGGQSGGAGATGSWDTDEKSTSETNFS